MKSLYFDFRDLFQSNRLAFSLQRIWIQFIGLAVGYFGYLVFTYVSLITGGNSFFDIWQKMGVLPCLAGHSANWISWLLFGMGVLFLIAMYLITATAVSRASYMLLKGNHFYTWKESFRFAFRKAGSVLFSPLALLMLIAFFVIGGVVIGLLGKIPFVGELGISIFYIFWLFAGLLLVLFIIVLATALVFSPSIIATTDEDAFEVVFQSFSIFWSQPWRLIIYETLSAALSIIGFVVLAFLVKRGFLIVDTIFAVTIGDKYINMMGQGMYILSTWISVTIGWTNSLFGDSATLFYFSHDFLQLQLPPVLTASSHIFAFMLLVFGGFVVSYGLATFHVGTTISYLVLRKKKENDNLLERKDKEEEQEQETPEEAAEETSEKKEESSEQQEEKKDEPVKKTRRSKKK